MVQTNKYSFSEIYIDEKNRKIVDYFNLNLNKQYSKQLLEYNITQQIEQILPEEAPGYYFIDINEKQALKFQKVVEIFFFSNSAIPLY